MTNPIPGLETKSSAVSVFLSFIVPGLGHLYLGKVLRGVAMVLLTAVFYLATWGVGQALHRQGEGVMAWYSESLRVAEDSARAEAIQEILTSERDTQWTLLRATLMVGGISFAWWVWGMISARRLCDKHNKAAFEKASKLTPREGEGSL